jgi:hypothetical protein
VTVPVWTPLAAEDARTFAVAEVSRDGTTACARSRDGRVACWGEYVRIEGHGWAPPSAVPVVLGGVTDAVDLVLAGALYVVRPDGTVTRVRDTQLGPVEGLAGVVQVERADNGVCARSRDGAVSCHGWISWLDGTTEATKRLELRGDALACGPRGCCAWDALGALSCVGRDEELGLGKKPAVPQGAPAKGVDAVVIGYEHACARAGGVHRCWGDPLPEGFAPPPGSTLTLGEEPCWLLDGRMTCLARGGGSFTLDGVAALAAGCAALSDGGLACWGDNEHGELADGRHGRPMRVTVPAEVPGVRASALAAAYHDTCAVQGERLWCWGGGAGAPQDVGPAPRRFEPAAYAAGCG